MRNKLKRSWELIKQCWYVLKLDKEMLLFPVLSLMAVIAVLISFLGAGWLALPETSEEEVETVVLGAYFLFYFVSFFIVVFFNTALVACALVRLDGGNPTVGTGLRAAAARVHVIFLWSLVSATVGLILKLIGSRSNLVIRIIAGLMGAAWAIASYFVVPLLVAENAGPFSALKRSAAIIRKTWGETLAAEIGMGAIFFLLGIPGWLLLVIAGTMVQTQPAHMIILAPGLLWLFGAMIMAAAMDGILRATLFNYANNGTTSDHLSADFTKNAFTRQM